MSNPIVSNPNDFKVVSFHNSTNFGFTPDMGCMYDGRQINGKTGAPGIDAGETVVLPYHIAHRLATNLAKVAMIRGVAETKQQLDVNGQPIVASLWDDVKLESLKNSYLTEMYSEEKPVAMSETDKLMAKVEEFRKLEASIDAKMNQMKEIVSEPVAMTPATGSPVATTGQLVPSQESKPAYQDKQDVIAELEKRGIKHDKRQNVENLKKLLA